MSYQSRQGYVSARYHRSESPPRDYGSRSRQGYVSAHYRQSRSPPRDYESRSRQHYVSARYRRSRSPARDYGSRSRQSYVSAHYRQSTPPPPRDYGSRSRQHYVSARYRRSRSPARDYGSRSRQSYVSAHYRQSTPPPPRDYGSRSKRHYVSTHDRRSRSPPRDYGSHLKQANIGSTHVSKSSPLHGGLPLPQQRKQTPPPPPPYTPHTPPYPTPREESPRHASIASSDSDGKHLGPSLYKFKKNFQTTLGPVVSLKKLDINTLQSKLQGLKSWMPPCKEKCSKQCKHSNREIVFRTHCNLWHFLATLIPQPPEQLTRQDLWPQFRVWIRKAQDLLRERQENGVQTEHHGALLAILDLGYVRGLLTDCTETHLTYPLEDVESA